MILRRLTLKNFGITKEAELEFAPGLNLVIGDNGSGKSTVLKAIRLHLLDKADGKLMDYVNWEAEGFSSDLTYGFRGADFESSMSYTEGESMKRLLTTSSGKLFKNSDVTKYLATILDPDLAQASMFSMEGEIDLIQCKPAVRREHLKQIYNLDFSKEADELEKEYKKLAETELAEATQRIALLQEKKYEPLVILMLPFSAEEIASLRGRKDQILSSLGELDSLDREVKGLQAQILQNSTLLEQNKTKVQTKNETLKTQQAELPKTQLAIESFGLEEAMVAYSAKLEVGLQTQRDRIASLKAEKDGIVLKRLPVPNTARTVELVSLIQTAKIELAQIKAKIALHAKGLCGECGRPFDVSHDSELQARQPILEAEIAALEAEQVALKAEETRYQEGRLQNETLMAKKKGLETTIASEEASLERASSQVQSLVASNRQVLTAELEARKTKLASLQESISRLLNEIAELIGAQGQLSAQILSASATVETLSTRLSGRAKLELEKSELTEKITRYDSVVADNKARKESNERLLEEEKADKAQIGELTDKVTELNARIDSLKRSRIILQKEFPSHVISRLVRNLEGGVNSFIQRTYKGRYQIRIVESKDSLDIVYGPKSKDCRLASGYERQLFSLAYRTALNKTQKLGLLVLDEVESAASESNSDILYQTLGRMMEFYEQMIIITHKEQAKELLEKDFKARVFTARGGEIARLS